MAGLAAEVPVLHDGGDAVDPGHRHGVAGNVHDHQTGIDGGEGLDDAVLSVRQAVLEAVVALGILMRALVEAAYVDDDVCGAGRGDGVGDELLIGAGLAEVLAGGDAVVCTAGVAYIAALIDDLGVRERLPDAVQRRNLVLGLQRGRAAADGHHLDGVLAGHEDALRAPDRQQPAVVLQQHDALGAYLAGGGIMLRGGETPGLVLGVHAGAEDKAQDPAGFGVQFLGPGTAVGDALKIRVGEEIGIVGVGLAHREPVGPGAELHVQAVGDGLVGVVDAAPVADHHSVEAPFTLEDVVQQVLVVAVPLALVEVVGAHYGPGAAFLDGGLEGREVDLVQSPVVDAHVCGEAVGLLIVEGIMLDAGGYVVALDPLHVRYDHLRREVRVLAHILEVAAVERGAVDVDSGAEKDVLLAVAGLFAYADAVEFGQGRVPGGGQRRQGREGRAGVAGPSGLLPLVP